MLCYINVANKEDAEICAMEPSVRILGFGKECPGFTDPFLSKPLSVDEPIWTNVGSQNVDVNEKFEKWNAYREQISSDLHVAMTSKQLRNRRIVIFERILAIFETIYNKTLDAKNVVKPISRQDELRGQSWAIIAFVGDADRDISRTLLIESMANEYFNFMCTKVSSDSAAHDVSDDYVVSAYFLKEDNVHLDNLFISENYNDMSSILSLKNEPMIALYGFSDDAEGLVEKSTKLAELPSLKHADIAVVAMYSWLFLESWKKSKSIKRTSRDPKADAFFKKMREAQE